MKTITLREVRTASLKMTFAMKNDKGLYDRYEISMAALLSKYPELSPLDGAQKFLEEHFSTTLGERVDVILIPDSGVSSKTVALDESIFTKGVIKALKKKKTNGILYQYNQNYSKLPDTLASILDTVGKAINRFLVKPINSVLHTIYGLDPIRDVAVASIQFFDDNEVEIPNPFDGSIKTKYQEYADLKDSKFFLPMVFDCRFLRAVTTVTFLAVKCEEENLGKAIEAVSLDLDIMAIFGLIMGHLTMPTIVELSNGVGNGKKVYGVIAFPILNSVKLMKLLQIKSPLDLSQCGLKELASIGVANAVPEGGINSIDGYPYQNLIGETIRVGIEQEKADADELTRLYKQMNEDNIRVKAKLRAKAQQNGDKA